MDSGGAIQYGVLGILGTVIAGLLTWRLRHDAAQDGRHSRFENNLQDRYDAALAKIEQLQTELQTAQDRRETQARRIRERDLKIRNLLLMLAPNERESAERWMPESAFAPLQELPDPKKRKD